jgi:ribosomal-protein-alanine N-acetyltransferase
MTTDTKHPAIRLVPVSRAHASEFQMLLEHPAVAEATPFPHPYPAGGAEEYVAGLIAGREAGSRYDFAICDPTGRPMGVVLLKDIDRAAGQAELGYWLGVPYWGKGYGRAAARAAIGLAFGELGLERLVAVCLDSNVASIKLLEKLGFLRVGNEPWALPKWPEPRTAVVFRLERSAWIGSA